MEEVSSPGLEGAWEIINRRRLYNRGESLATHMHQLYPVLLKMSVVVQAEGSGKEYAYSVPAY